jgi:hypothetical protein
MLCAINPPSLRGNKPFGELAKALRRRGAKGGDMVDIRGWLLSLVLGLGFWAFVSVCLSLLIH